MSERLAILAGRMSAGARAQKQFGAALKSTRRRVGLNQKDCAALLGVSHKHVNQIELGVAMPSASFARTAARALGRLDDGINHTYLAKKRERAGRPRKG